MVDDPRGGWRFRDPEEQRVHGPDADPAAIERSPIDPYNVQRPEDLERQRFGGDPQNPAHGFPRSGTQGTWDDSLGRTGGPPEVTTQAAPDPTTPKARPAAPAAPTAPATPAPARPPEKDLQRLADDGGPPAKGTPPAAPPAPPAAPPAPPAAPPAGPPRRRP